MRWIRALGYIIAVLGTIWASARTIVDWLGRLDFVVSHREELGGIGRAVEYLTAPTWWLPWCVLATGLMIIWADSRRRIKATANAPETPDVNLTIECNLADLPNRCPREGQIASMRLFYSPGSEIAEPIGFITKHCRPGTDVEWFPDLKFPQVYRCEITNYGGEPLLQVSLMFKIEYREMLEAAAGHRQAGGAAHSREWPVLLPKIDPGKSNAVVFYIYNESRYFASVIPPPVASFITLNGRSRNHASVLRLAWWRGCPSGRWSGSISYRSSSLKPQK